MFVTDRACAPADPGGVGPMSAAARTGSRSGPGGLCGRLRGVVAELGRLDPTGSSRADLVDVLEALTALEAAVVAAQAVVTNAVDELGDRGAPGDEVLRSVSGCSEREARRRSRRARTLREMPTTAGLLADGRLSPEGADLLAEAGRRVSVAAADTDPALLAEVTGRPADVARRAVDAWIRRHEAAGAADERLRRQRRDRSGTWWVDIRDGMHRFRFDLDPVTGASVRAVLEAETQRLWRADGGREGSPAEVRSPEQRRADAVARCLGVEAPGPATDPEPPAPSGASATIVVVADLGVVDGTDPDARCEIVDTGPVPPAVLTGLARRSDTSICGALFAGPGEALWLGRSKRLATRPQRLVMAVRDRGCVACGAPFSHTQAHHSTSYRHGGSTDVDVLVSLCPTCHGRVHAGRLELRRRPDGTWRAVTTTGGDRDPP